MLHFLKRFKIIGLYFCLFIITAGSPFACFATPSCRPATGGLNLNLTGNFFVQRDAGKKVISQWADVKSTDTWLECTSATAARVWMASGVNPTAETISVDGIEYKIYSTNIKGIGYILKSQGQIRDGDSGWVDNWSWGWKPEPDSTNYGKVSQQWGNDARPWEGAVESQVALVKYDTSESGTLSVNNALKAVLASDGDDPNGITSKGTVNVSITGTVISAKCTASNPSLTFDMGGVEVNAFSGVGSTSAASVSSNLIMDCDKDTNINVVFTGVQNTDTPSDDSVLALTPGESNAKGVGVQVLYNDEPLLLNKMMNVKTSSGGQEAMEFKARYIQTMQAITPGKANTTAVLNLIYQ